MGINHRRPLLTHLPATENATVRILAHRVYGQSNNNYVAGTNVTGPNITVPNIAGSNVAKPTGTKSFSSGRFAAGGFTLVELLITISILSILMSIGIPSFTRFLDTNALKAAGQQVHGHIKQAHSEAIARNTDISVNFSADGTTTWAYGISNVDSCDLTVTDPANAAACTLVVDDGDGTVHGEDGSVDTNDKVLARYTNQDHEGILMSTANFLNGTQVGFEPRRGTAIGNTGDILLESEGGKKLLIRVSALGQVRICSPDGSVNSHGYADGNGADDADC